MEEEFTEKQVMLFIKNKGTVKLSEIMAEYGKSNYLARSIISRPLVLNLLKEERIKGDSIITFVEPKPKIVNDSVTINPLDNSDPILGIPPKSENVDTELANPSDIPTVADNIVLPSKDIVDGDYLYIEGLGLISHEKLSEWFAEGILTIDISKLIPKLKNVQIDKDKLIFEV